MSEILKYIKIEWIKMRSNWKMLLTLTALLILTAFVIGRLELLITGKDGDSQYWVNQGQPLIYFLFGAGTAFLYYFLPIFIGYVVISIIDKESFKIREYQKLLNIKFQLQDLAKSFWGIVTVIIFLFLALMMLTMGALSKINQELWRFKTNSIPWDELLKLYFLALPAFILFVFCLNLIAKIFKHYNLLIILTLYLLIYPLFRIPVLDFLAFGFWPADVIIYFTDKLSDRSMPSQYKFYFSLIMLILGSFTYFIFINKQEKIFNYVARKPKNN